MPYISFPSAPTSTGRTVRDACTDPATGAYVCEVDEVLDGDTEITVDEHARIKAAAETAYENQPAPEPEDVPVQVSLADEVAALRAIVTTLAPDAVAASPALGMQALKG